MSEAAPASPEILILGAGVLGLSTAVELGRRGLRAVVVDPGGASASSIAAGMIAPAAEALADWRVSYGAYEHSDLFRDGRDVWPAFAEAAGITLYREGVEWRGRDAAEVACLWRDWRFDASENDQVALTPADWRVEPVETLARMAAAPGVSVRAGRAEGLESMDGGWRVRLADGETLDAASVVVATGADVGMAGPSALQAVFDNISPIRGQLAFTPERIVARTIRGAAGYLSPAAGGTVLGATMEPGRRDLNPDPVGGAALNRKVLGLIGAGDGERSVEWRVGVRGSTPDGLPMAGAVGSGLHVALAPRRNGWLLGPLVGRIVADGIEGRAPGAWARDLDPLRFL